MMGDLLPCPFCGGVPELVGNTLFCRSKTHQTFGIHRDEWNTRLAAQAVVSQDLVPVAWMYERQSKLSPDHTGTKVGEYRWPEWMLQGWTETPLYPASAIEAAQIAARNEALDEAAKVADDLDTFDRDVRISAAKAVVAIDISAAIRALRSQGAE